MVKNIFLVDKLKFTRKYNVYFLNYKHQTIFILYGLFEVQLNRYFDVEKVLDMRI